MSRTTVPFSQGVVTRSSGAYNPYDGAAQRANTPRIWPSRIPSCTWAPRIYYTHLPLTEMTYTAYLIRQTQFETAYPEFTKVTLGTSFSGRPIVAYRLGPVNRKHFVITSVVHGNEHDGLEGNFKAAQFLAREPEFGPFRSEYTLFWIPVCNPDGYFSNLRNLAHVGPNGQTVNLNRNWDWFWPEYVESTLESKGTAPESEAETLAILNYFRTGNSGGPVTFGALFDCHANNGQGCRYQSRDRVGWRDVPSGSAGYVMHWFDAFTYRIWEAMNTLRVRTLAAPELYVQYHRSRMIPHLHSYFSSLGVPAMVIEEIKVDSAGGYETYASASDFRMDYILACAIACTADTWTFKDSVLIEKGGTNLLTNADFRDWQDYWARPSYYWLTRMNLAQTTEKLLENGGQAVQLQADIECVTPTIEEYTAACNDELTSDGSSSAILLPSTHTLFRIPISVGDAAIVGVLALHTQCYGAAMVNSGAHSVDILGGGTAELTGAVNTVHRVNTATAVESAVGNIVTARMHAGYCDNFLAFPAAGSEKGYVIGGVNGAGARLASFGTWTPSTTTYAASAQSLVDACHGCCAVYYPADGHVFIFGGSAAAGMLITIQEWDPVADTLVTLATVLPTACGYMTGAFYRGDGCIYLYGGQDGSGDMLSQVLKFDPTTDAITVVTPLANTDDREDAEYPGDEGLWGIKLGRWASSAILESASDNGSILLANGRFDTTVGTLTDQVYIHDLTDNVISRSDVNSYGYIRYSLPVVDTKYSTFVSDDFAAGINLAVWSNPSAAWVDGGGYAKGASGVSGPLILISTPTMYENSLSLDVSYSGSAVAPDFAVVMRAVYAGAALTSGYRLRYDLSLTTWLVERVIGGVATTVASYDVSALATRRITTVMRTLVFEVSEFDPVHIVVTFNSLSLFDVYDFNTSRIKTLGKVGIFGGSS